jgi:ribonuclease D
LQAEPMAQLKPELFHGDLPDHRVEQYLKKSMIAIDTETRGLIIPRDRLCLIQLCDDEGVVSLVRYENAAAAPNLRRLLIDQNVTKLFHYARFDVAVMKHWLGEWTGPIWCTKIASKLVRTYTDRHSLKELCREQLGREMDKADQTSDWAKEDLTESQMEYAANDVRYLHALQRQMKALLEREGRLHIAEKMFAFLPTVCELDLMGFSNMFEH